MLHRWHWKKRSSLPKWTMSRRERTTWQSSAQSWPLAAAAQTAQQRARESHAADPKRTLAHKTALQQRSHVLAAGGARSPLRQARLGKVVPLLAVQWWAVRRRVLLLLLVRGLLLVRVVRMAVRLWGTRSRWEALRRGVVAEEGEDGQQGVDAGGAGVEPQVLLVAVDMPVTVWMAMWVAQVSEAKAASVLQQAMRSALRPRRAS